MKKILISLTAASILLTGCGKESDFKKAINEKLNSKYLCLNIAHGTPFGSSTNEDDFNKFTEKTKQSSVFSHLYNKDGKTTADVQEYQAQLDALVSIGLYKKTSESLPTFDWNKKPDGEYYKYDIYTMTDAGKANKGITNSGQETLCYAHPEVVSIDNYAEENQSSYQIARVKYTYKYVDIADWINKPGIKEAFPEITEKLDNPNKTDTISLVKTNNGWSSDL